MPPILDIRKLNRRYGKLEALGGIDLCLDKPGIYGFLGPNGAGKTTTIKIIAGLLRPTSGSVAIDGHDIQANPVAALQRLGLMMESPAFYSHLTGQQNLTYIAKLCGWPQNGAIAGMLHRVGLGAKMHVKVGAYSRGMRQRLGVAAALLGDPALLVLDEPTNGLDPSGIVEMRHWLQDLAKQENRTVLLSSHQMGEVERICDRITIIDQGRIIAEGRTEEIIRPKNTILVRTPMRDDAQRVLKGAQEIESVETVDGDSLRVKSGQLSSADINRLLTHNGVDVNSITEERESLEDAFFRLVGQRHDVA